MMPADWMITSPPGSGEIDFKKIGTWIGDDTLKVIELKPGTRDSEVASGIHYFHDRIPFQ